MAEEKSGQKERNEAALLTVTTRSNAFVELPKYAALPTPPSLMHASAANTSANLNGRKPHQIERSNHYMDGLPCVSVRVRSGYFPPHATDAEPLQRSLFAKLRSRAYPTLSHSRVRVMASG